jgi:hypothetical protein
METDSADEKAMQDDSKKSIVQRLVALESNYKTISDSKKWYRDASNWISTFALISSIAFFVISTRLELKKEGNDESSSRRTKSQELVDQLLRNEDEIAKSYQDRATALHTPDWLIAKKRILIESLYQLMHRHPDDFSSDQYLSMAGEFVFENKFDKAVEMCKIGLRYSLDTEGQVYNARKLVFLYLIPNSGVYNDDSAEKYRRFCFQQTRKISGEKGLLFFGDNFYMFAEQHAHLLYERRIVERELDSARKYYFRLHPSHPGRKTALIKCSYLERFIRNDTAMPVQYLPGKWKVSFTGTEKLSGSAYISPAQGGFALIIEVYEDKKMKYMLQGFVGPGEGDRWLIPLQGTIRVPPPPFPKPPEGTLVNAQLSGYLLLKLNERKTFDGSLTLVGGSHGFQRIRLRKI